MLPLKVLLHHQRTLQPVARQAWDTFKVSGRDRFTIAEVARLLDVTSAGVADQISKGRWSETEYDRHTRTFSRESVTERVRELYRKLRGRVGRIEASAFEFQVTLETSDGRHPDPRSDTRDAESRLAAQLADEIRRHASAEERVRHLEEDLARANEAIEDLTVRPRATDQASPPASQ